MQSIAPQYCVMLFYHKLIPYICEAHDNSTHERNFLLIIYFEVLYIYPRIFMYFDSLTTDIIHLHIAALSMILQLSNVLQIDLGLVKNAVSMYCRLGFARRKGQDLDMEALHPSWQDILQANEPKSMSMLCQYCLA